MDINTLKVDELMGKLQTQEMNFRANIREKKKVKNMAFQAEASHGISQDQTFHEYDIDVEESLAIMSNNLESLRQKLENRRSSSKSGKYVNPKKFKKFSNNGYSDDAKSRRMQCRECGSFGHIQAECANTLKKKRMSLTTVWSDKEDSDEDENNKEDQTTNFMAFSGTTHISKCKETVAETVATVCPTELRYDELSSNKDNSLTSPFNFAGDSESSSDDEQPTLEEVKDVYEKMYRKWLEVSEVNKRLEEDKRVLIEENEVLNVRISTLEQNSISTSRETDRLKVRIAQTQDAISKFNTGRVTLNEILTKNQSNSGRIGIGGNQLSNDALKRKEDPKRKINFVKQSTVSQTVATLASTQSSQRKVFVPTCDFCHVPGHIRPSSGDKASLGNKNFGNLNCDKLCAKNKFMNPIQHSKTKLIDICHRFIRDLVEKGVVSIDYAATKSLQIKFRDPVNRGEMSFGTVGMERERVVLSDVEVQLSGLGSQNDESGGLKGVEDG
ncbi:PREDICTED: uncharacterized protein LOC105974897 [Erythranthe guttata]|uniref:uncharacterized protein LOC105974897 n=1 Tax=Erythranthe guttata TaxID=4155 RepID=UPI00064D8A6B|nr:PREDICTED: uncharacterized protein LOC105974897 [Erythranthe guttata]|eukprot:XP_012855510.1 PREDICTED: uncharacterized protein LOC105974897 [Erythranthe guttata]